MPAVRFGSWKLILAPGSGGWGTGGDQSQPVQLYNLETDPAEQHNLQSEHERFLAEEHFKCPVTVHDYPRTLKPFYMRVNDDGRTVRAMDLLVPGIGEIIGGTMPVSGRFITFWRSVSAA